MEQKLIETPNGTVAVIQSEIPLITNGQSALDFAVNAGAYLIAVNKAAIAEDFFKLSTGIAGEVVQKFVNYGPPCGFGNFSGYTSKPLHDYLKPTRLSTAKTKSNYTKRAK
ncbi:MAG: DUF4180 domain-containing protein [Burkholderiales bacterium]|jgi:hypothetical protein|nr:DUF4180 domain-containing protein [Burkholderiales bacterium]